MYHNKICKKPPIKHQLCRNIFYITSTDNKGISLLNKINLTEMYLPGLFTEFVL